MKFALVNASTLMDDPEAVGLMAQAISQQITDDAGPAWGRYGDVTSYPDVQSVPDDAIPIVIYDDADQAGALGWHTEELGKFFGRIFVRPVLEAGGDFYSNPALSVSSVVSHEVLETLIDPTVSDWSARGDGMLIASEIGDPVEADSYPINVQPFDKNVMVSNFVLPAWFDAENTQGPFDKLQKLTAPFSMTPGGYMVQMEQGPTSEVGARQPGRAEARSADGRSAHRRATAA